LLFYHKSLASWASGFIFYQLKRGCALFLFSATAPHAFALLAVIPSTFGQLTTSISGQFELAVTINRW
jgi:hypothetical protein